MGRQRLAWFIIGSGVLFWGIGEIIRVLYEYVLQVEARGGLCAHLYDQERGPP